MNGKVKYWIEFATSLMFVTPALGTPASGGIYANATVTFPTAALLLPALNAPKVGDIVNFLIVPISNVIPTIAGGTLGSVGPSGGRASRPVIIRITNVTTPAYTIY